MFIYHKNTASGALLPDADSNSVVRLLVVLATTFFILIYYIISKLLAGTSTMYVSWSVTVIGRWTMSPSTTIEHKNVTSAPRNVNG